MPHRVFFGVLAAAALIGETVPRVTDVPRDSLSTALILLLLPFFAFSAWKTLGEDAEPEPAQASVEPSDTPAATP